MARLSRNGIVAMIAAGAFLAAPGQVLTAGPAQILVAGHWLNLPIPAGYCSLDPQSPVDAEFMDLQARGALSLGRHLLLVFANCDELIAAHHSKRQVFSYGSYDVTIVEHEAYELPEALLPAEFISALSRKHGSFDRAAADTALHAKAGIGDDISGTYASEPDATYLATLTSLPAVKPRRAALPVLAMTVTTTIGRVPIVTSIVSFETDFGKFDELFAQAKSVVGALHAANSVPQSVATRRARPARRTKAVGY